MPNPMSASNATNGCDWAGTVLPLSIGCEQAVSEGAMMATITRTASNRNKRIFTV